METRITLPLLLLTCAAGLVIAQQATLRPVLPEQLQWATPPDLPDDAAPAPPPP